MHLFDLTDAARRADEEISRLAPAARDALAKSAQRSACADGLMRGTTPIPLVLSPCSLPREELGALGRDARLIVSALVRIARDLLERRPERSHLLFHHLAPLEREALATRWQEAEELLISRVDWFVDRQGHAHALEVNATIPAMPVYSDAAVSGFLEAFRPQASSVENGSNADWLVSALLHVARHRRQPIQVQILHRDGDPQRTELTALVERLRARGVEARTCTPQDVALDGDPHRVLYRHLFARNVEPQTPLGRAFLDPVRHGMWNRVDGWLETKGLFAELSLLQDSLLLTADEREAVRRSVPWTRLLDDASDGEVAGGDAFVLKKSHDYGGKSVVIGRESGKAAFAEAVARARRDDPGSWVVQRLVDAPAIDRWLVEQDRAVRVPLHLDISTYASLVPGVPDGGSVCRAAPGRIVNIVGGGGVAPLFADDVLRAAL